MFFTDKEDPDDREQMRLLFTAAYERRKTKKNVIGIKADYLYDEMVGGFPKKNFSQLLSTKEINWLKRFECELQGNREVLLCRGKIVVKESHLFDFLYNVHLNLGHIGRDGMNYELSKDFNSISKEIISVFLKCCQKCELKKGKVKAGVVVQPILSAEQNSRVQIDLIDYKAKPDGEFLFIMIYQDLLTKFVILRPLKRKTGEAVAEQLVEIFSVFGAPKILQSDNGKEFVNNVIKELTTKWPHCNKIQGKPRQSQSQDSVERANRDIEDILQCMMAEERTPSWSKLLPQVQLAKNSRYHSGIKMSPFEDLLKLDNPFVLMSYYYQSINEN